jgi:hypothetical protein
MSGVANLYNVPSNDDELKAWATIHAQHHRDINRVIYQLVKIVIPEYVLDPIDPDDTGNWEDNHQEMHRIQDGILGIPGFDLTGFDLKDQRLLAGWIYLNGQEHHRAADILEIG